MMANGIRIRSAVFPQCTGQTDAPTDRSSTVKFDDYSPLRLSRERRGLIIYALLTLLSDTFDVKLSVGTFRHLPGISVSRICPCRRTTKYAILRNNVLTHATDAANSSDIRHGRNSLDVTYEIQTLADRQQHAYVHTEDHQQPAALLCTQLMMYPPVSSPPYITTRSISSPRGTC